MRFAIPLFAACIFAPLLQCALTYTDGGAGQTAQSEYYDPASPDGNAGYFSNVRRHFEEFGVLLSESDVRLYTAARFISTVPPGALVYAGVQCAGRANDGPLYFLPGQYQVTFWKNGRQWSDILVFVAGRNASLVARAQ